VCFGHDIISVILVGGWYCFVCVVCVCISHVLCPRTRVVFIFVVFCVVILVVYINCVLSRGIGMFVFFAALCL